MKKLGFKKSAAIPITIRGNLTPDSIIGSIRITSNYLPRPQMKEILMPILKEHGYDTDWIEEVNAELDNEETSFLFNSGPMLDFSYLKNDSKYVMDFFDEAETLREAIDELRKILPPMFKIELDLE